MSSLMDIITVGRSGVLSQQERLNVIGHNITNAQTEGYHRQKAVLATNPANMPNLSTTLPYSQGTGVMVEDVVREFDLLRENSLRDELSDAGQHKLLADMMPDIESLMQVGTDTGINQTLTEFWVAWQDVATHPDDLTMRNVLLEKAGQLTDSINKINGSLEDYRSGIIDGVSPNTTGAMVDDAETFNEITTSIQALNQKITIYQSSRVSTADLEDKRDLLVRELSGLADVDIDVDYNISLNGQTVVNSNGTVRNDLEVTASDPVAFELGGVAVTIASGKLSGWQEMASYIDTMSDNLDTLASELISQVNSLHVSGYDLNGNSGVDFFTGADANTFAVNTALYNPENPLLNNPTLVAAAKTLHDPGGPDEGPNTGDGSNALAIADLSAAKLGTLNNQTFNGFYTDMTTSLGSKITSETEQAEDAAQVIQMLSDAIQSESGVNLDEELIDMISAQRAYQAAAKLVSQANQMFDVILNLK